MSSPRPRIHPLVDIQPPADQAETAHTDRAPGIRQMAGLPARSTARRSTPIVAFISTSRIATFDRVPTTSGRRETRFTGSSISSTRSLTGDSAPSGHRPAHRLRHQRARRAGPVGGDPNSPRRASGAPGPSSSAGPISDRTSSRVHQRDQLERESAARLRQDNGTGLLVEGDGSVLRAPGRPPRRKSDSRQFLVVPPTATAEHCVPSRQRRLRRVHPATGP